jgi:hypothetical protein
MHRVQRDLRQLWHADQARADVRVRIDEAHALPRLLLSVPDLQRHPLPGLQHGAVPALPAGAAAALDAVRLG